MKSISFGPDGIQLDFPHTNPKLILRLHKQTAEMDTTLSPPLNARHKDFNESKNRSRLIKAHVHDVTELHFL